LANLSGYSYLVVYSQWIGISNHLASKSYRVEFSALGATLGQAVGTVLSVGTKNITNAMTARAIKRLIAVSTIGVADTRDKMSFWGKMFSSRYHW